MSLDFMMGMIAKGVRWIVANLLTKTGQTTSYVDYDDGYYEKGWDEGVRFTDNDDGTITDNATGLMWVKDWTGAGANNGDYLTWQGAIDFAEALNFAGHQDWRLPNVLEIMSILNFGAKGPAAYSAFSNVPDETLWSGSTAHNSSTSAWSIYVETGTVATFFKTLSVCLVLPVRTA